MSGQFPWREAQARVAKRFQDSARARDEVLRERAVHLARPMQPLGVETEERLCFAVGGEWACVATQSVRSIGRLGTLTPIPDSPPQVLGLARVRGALTPIFDLGPILTGGATERTERSRVLVLHGPGPDLAVIAGEVEDASPGVDVLLLDVAKLLGDARLTVDQTDEL